MKRVLVLCEGQTEQQFVNNVLAPHLLAHDYFGVTPTLVRTGAAASGQPYFGGSLKWDALQKELRRLLGDPACLVTTMIDLYGISDDIPGWGPPTTGTGAERADVIEAAIADEVGSPHLIPYIQVHEYEALLYSSPQAFADYFGDARLVGALTKDLGHRGPEDVNDSPITAPAKRLKGHRPDYRKEVGPVIVGEIGLDHARSQCPHFDGWLTRLESWKPPA